LTPSGFTLVELLVVVTIIGILIALLLPAVQAAREAARCTQCKNHLKQLSLGFVEHVDKVGHLPSGGWSFRWNGDPDRGFGKDQPGGWVYNILPYIEQDALHQLGAGKSPADKRLDANTISQTPLAVFNCPTRRRCTAYPNAHPSGYTLSNADRVSPVAKSDYAANGGHLTACPCTMAQSLTQGDDPNFPWEPENRGNTGIINQRSEYQMALIRDGTSNTFMLGEKYLSPDYYSTGVSGADDHSMYCAYDQDTIRWACAGQMDAMYIQDRQGYTIQGWGSAHAPGAHFALCDGSVHMIHYGIDLTTFVRMVRREDGQPVDASKY